MANETSKQMMRRCSDRRFATRWIVGEGIDIGCGPDPLSRLADFFPLMRSLKPWDMPDGDAMLMAGVADESYDFVHSSHCLEHLVDPLRAMTNWVRICKPGGHLVITVPEEDLYEQGVWPSTFNADHKWTFTILKSKSWSPRSISVLNLLAAFQEQVEILKVEKLDGGFDYKLPRTDQTLGGLAESAIEFVLRKKPRAPQPGNGLDAPGSQALAAVGARLQEAEGLLKQGQAAAAEAMLQHLLSLVPQLKPALDLRLRALEALGRFDDAIALLTAHPDHFQPAEQRLFRMAELSEHAARNDQAMRYLDEALAVNPQHAMSLIHRGRQHMRRGDFERGVQGLAVIYAGRVPRSQIGLFADEEGNPIDQTGKTVVLSADSGLGDTMQFVRYAPMVKALGARVVVECQPALSRLIATMPGVDAVVAQGELSAAFDERLPLHNLMGAFRTTLQSVPSGVPYLRADAAAAEIFRARLAPLGGRKVGLVWSGNPNLPRNAARSIDPALLAPLMAIPGLSFVSLQKGGAPGPAGLVDWTGELNDMADTAALVHNLDLVISVDSAVAHLAGALGRPVWLLNRLDACWRWLDGRDDSPWYPTMSLFRQREAGAWGDVLQRVAAGLHEWADRKAA